MALRSYGAPDASGVRRYAGRRAACPRCHRGVVARSRRGRHPSGRRGRVAAAACAGPPVGAWADERGIETLTPAAAARAGVPRRRLTAIAPDCVPVVAYGALVPPAALAIPTHGWINLALLAPTGVAWRGPGSARAAAWPTRSPAPRCSRLESAWTRDACSARLIEEIRPRRHRRRPVGSAVDQRSFAAGRRTRRDRDRLASMRSGNRTTAYPSPLEDHRLPRREVRWSEPAFAVDRRGACMHPWSRGAWTTFRGERLKYHAGTPDQRGAARRRGPVVVERRAYSWVPATAPVALGDVQAAGEEADASGRLGPWGASDGDDVLGTARAPVPSIGDARSAG